MADLAPDRVGRRHSAPSVAAPDLRVVRERHRDRRRPSASVVARRSLVFLLVPAFLLTVIGLVEVFSASSVVAYQTYGNSFYFFERQVLYAAMGFVAMLGASRMRYRAWQRLSVPFLAICVVLLVIALHPTAGASAYGASRWIDLGPFTLQPSEFAKLALIAFAATVLSRKWELLDDPWHVFLPVGPVVIVVAGVVLLQRDFGTTIVLTGSVFLMLFAAGARMRHLAVTGTIGLAGSAYLVLGTSYRRARFLAFLHPSQDPRSTGWQLLQGLIALGSGGWFGVGLGASRQKWAYLPNAHTDFIFAVLGEEMGLIGEIVVLCLFALMIYAGLRIAVHAPDRFGRLLAAGITSWIGLQAIVNLGAVTGLLPITGVPLPLVSFGGSALIVSLVGVGVLASIARASIRKATPRRRPATSRAMA